MMGTRDWEGWHMQVRGLLLPVQCPHRQVLGPIASTLGGFLLPSFSPGLSLLLNEKALGTHRGLEFLST